MKQQRENTIVAMFALAYVVFACAGTPLWNLTGIVCALAFSAFCANLVDQLTE